MGLLYESLSGASDSPCGLSKPVSLSVTSESQSEVSESLSEASESLSRTSERQYWPLRACLRSQRGLKGGQR